MKYIDAFEKIKEKLSDADTSTFEKDFAIQINIKNKDCGGAFYIAYKDGIFYVEPYDYVDNDAMLDVMMGDLNKLFEGKLNIEKSMSNGKINITGSVDTVLLLSGIVHKTADKKSKNK